MRGRLIAATVLLITGLVWVGQGVGLLRGSSPMVDDLRWAVAGAVAIAIAVGLAVSVWRPARRQP
jgi:hypothetical protein